VLLSALECAARASASHWTLSANSLLPLCPTRSSGRAAAPLFISHGEVQADEVPAPPDSAEEAESPEQSVCARTARFPHVEACCGVEGAGQGTGAGGGAQGADGGGCPRHVWLYWNESLSWVATGRPPWVALVARFDRKTVALTTTPPMTEQDDSAAGSAAVAKDNLDAIMVWSVGRSEPRLVCD